MLERTRTRVSKNCYRKNILETFFLNSAKQRKSLSLKFLSRQMLVRFHETVETLPKTFVVKFTKTLQIHEKYFLFIGACSLLIAHCRRKFQKYIPFPVSQLTLREHRESELPEKPRTLFCSAKNTGEIAATCNKL